MSVSFDRGEAYAVFEKALDMDAPARAAFLAQACSNHTLRTEVEALLQMAERSYDTNLILASAEGPAEDLVGREFGRFRLLERIGEGGMGVVYRAERTDGIKQIVAVKLIAQGLIAAGQERFRRETQILARLEHPMIARLIDAGIDAGRPWIALEFVIGQPIDRYCEKHRLGLRDRIRLLANLAGAVAAAHRQLVVHRDIKPANVLVTEEGVPRLIDFGIAAALQDPGAAHSPTVDIGKLFTPQFAAPEQVLGQPITVATDVFGLGALGYHILSGRTIFPAARSAVSYMLAVTQEDVPPLSSAALEAGERQNARRFAGDLDAIFAKAMQRDPSQRYLTAAELQGDLHRYLDNEPTLARPPSPWQRALKFARRNAGTVAVAAVLIIAAATTSAIYTVQARRAATARNIAVRRGEFLQNMLGSADVRHGGDRSVTVASLLDRSMPQIERMAEDEPLVAASMFGLVAQTDKGLARYTEGLTASTRQVELLRANQGAALDLADALSLHAEMLLLSGKPREAAPWITEELRLVEHRSDAPKQLADALENMANMDAKTGHEAEAEALYQREIQVFASSRQDFGGRRAFPLSGLASLRANQGRYLESSQYVGQALAIERQYFSPDDPDLLDAEYDYAVSLEQAHKPADAEPVFRSLLASYRRIFGSDNSQAYETQQGLAHDLWAQGRYPEAAEEAKQSAEGLSRTDGEDNAWTQTAWGIYGISTCLAGHADEGLAVLRRIAALRAQKSGADHWGTQSTQVHIGTCLVAQHRYAEAEPLLLKAATFLEKDRGVDFDRTQAAYRALSDLYAAVGKGEEARVWARKLRSDSDN
jgi:serine/threonine-protein kinase